MRSYLRRFGGLTLTAGLMASHHLPQSSGASPAKITPQTTLAQSSTVAGPQIRLLPRNGTFRFAGGILRVANFQDEVPEPEQPPVEQPPVEQPPVTADTDAAAVRAGGPQALSLESISIDDLRTTNESPGAPATGTTAGEAIATGATDLGQLLSQSVNTETVDVQRRSPVALDPNIRGYRQGQIYSQADGVYWLAARQDLDTMLTKIDPTMIDSVVVLSGPYGVQYGPGLAFIDIQTALTPRYECCPEHHVRSLASLRTNGGQMYSRTTAYGGDSDWGYRLSYGDKKGSDYLSGNDIQIPSSYDTNDIWAQWGYSFNPDQRLEVSYLRYEQIDTEYPGQFFNIDDLITDAANIRLIDEGCQGPWSRFIVEGWWNRTRFNGDNFGKHNPEFHEVRRAEFAFGRFNQFNLDLTRIDALTAGDLESTGTRAMFTFGELEDRHFNLGADLRYIEQNITEDVFISSFTTGVSVFPVNQRIFTNMPRSWAFDPGMFAEYVMPLSSFWTAKIGARADFYNTRASFSELRTGGQLMPIVDDPGDLDQEDILYAFFLTNEVQLDCHWTLLGGFGHGQRAPTLIERYADGLFLGVAQSGFTRVIGDPDLDEERCWQFDLGLKAEYDYWRGRASVFYAQVDDYVTLDGNIVTDPPMFESARLFRYTATDRATLAGFEATGEYDWSCYLSPFAAVKYVEGRDEIIDAPLTQIPPLDTVVGIRLHEPSRARNWSVEFGARVVDNQDRLGTVRSSQGTSVIEEETPGFAVCHLRSYYNYSRNMHFTAGIENLFDRNYQEHLDLRLRGPADFPGGVTRTLAPGITPYIGVDYTY